MDPETRSIIEHHVFEEEENPVPYNNAYVFKRTLNNGKTELCIHLESSGAMLFVSADACDGDIAPGH